MAQQSPPPKAQWPKKGEKHKAAIDAFTKTLTRASHDWDFRQKLIKLDSAKVAVAEEGNIDIPDTEVIVFYVNEATGGSAPGSRSQIAGTATKGEEKTWTDFFPDRSNEHYHFFCLPPFDRNGTKEEIYQKWQTGAYRVWWE
jgi:hypothetical protein